jgi:predicted nicotinamide N-methyase
VTPLLAQWFVSPTNILFASGILHRDAHVLELGCGISGLLSLALAPLVKSYIATDKGYITQSKALKQNIMENSSVSQPARKSQTTRPPRGQKPSSSQNIIVRALDWESDSVSHLYHEIDLESPQQIDLLVACDCIYNESLVTPFVETCEDICRLSPPDSPTVCLVAQQIRSPDVFQLWLAAFHERFRTWRVPGDLIGDAMSDGSGFAVHIGILRK